LDVNSPVSVRSDETVCKALSTMSTTSKGDSADAVGGEGEDGVVVPADAVDQSTVVNCAVSVNHSTAAETNDAELGVKTPAANTTVRYRSERRRWSSLERYLVVVSVVLLMTTVTLAAIVVAFSFIETGQYGVVWYCRV